VSRIDAVALTDCSIVLVRLQRSYDRLQFRPRAVKEPQLTTIHLTVWSQYR